MTPKSLTTAATGGTDRDAYLEVTIQLELEGMSEISGHELAEILLDAVEADDRISIDFACTTTDRSNH